MISVTNSHPPSPALQSFAHSVATSNKTLGGYQLLIQQGDADMQGPHSWPGSYYDPQPISGSVGSVVPAVPPITYSGSHANNDPHQPWTPTAINGPGLGNNGNNGNNGNRGYYEALTTSSTPTTPGFPPVDSPGGWGGSNDNSEPTAVGSDLHTHAGNKYVDVGHVRDFGLTALPVRGPQVGGVNVGGGGAPSNYVRPPQH
ncbi:MAG: hypothetical protein J3R72DRAFT_446943 [Linnemannia gamsii]|nr:MAG: hypothetical protein J3R72DRAFT_446943 [Linnemannia gamsii]